MRGIPVEICLYITTVVLIAISHALFARQTMSLRKELVVVVSLTVIAPLCCYIPWEFFPRDQRGFPEGNWLIAAGALTISALAGCIVAFALWIHLFGRTAKFLLAKRSSNSKQFDDAAEKVE